MLRLSTGHKYFVLVQIFSATPKIEVHIVPVANIWSQKSSQMQLNFWPGSKNLLQHKIILGQGISFRLLDRQLECLSSNPML